uniref:Integrase catalytic domain-containing protein n=1 Tax=Chenopodium quinoa TaxID=63459 RepID=A0A803N6I0_CHEQI
MDIEYQPRKAIKSQSLEDFVADFSPDLQAIVDKEVEEINNVQSESKWILFVDGLSNQRGAGLGMVLKSPQGDMIVSQIIGDFPAKDSKMTTYLDIAKEKAKHFHPSTILQIPRDQNVQADTLANLASALKKTTFINIPLVHLQKPSVSFKEILPVSDVNNGDDWTRPIKFRIELRTSTPRYPQANGQAESSNKVVMEAIKKRLKAAKGKRADELPSVLWANRTTPREVTRQTPFSLVYGCEAVLPFEADFPTSRFSLMTEERNQEETEDSIDAIEELRETELIRMAAQQQIVARSFNKNIKAKTFQLGDWVLRRAFQNTMNPADGKLAPPREGPYEITQVIGNGAYRLTDQQGNPVPRSWNANHLKKYYFQTNSQKRSSTKR